ncbi:MAG: spore coat associated protein CotJA [Clostridia bacterium]|nr:spore coat associated protein CotJA [Clostridia bacterium]
MMYVPFQTDMTTFDEMTALRCGTLFPVLSKPFLGSGNR